MGDFIADNFQIVLIIGGAIAYFVNLFRQAKEAERQAKEEQQRPVDYEEIFGPDFDFGEEPGRDGEERPSVPSVFFPTTTTPPPLPPPPQRAPAFASERELQRQEQLQNRLAEARKIKAERWESSRSVPRPAALPTAPVVPSSNRLKNRMKNRGEVRSAFVMREVLGPPVAFK